MLKALKWLAISALLVATVVIAVVALAVALIDPDDYRERIAEELQSRLDRPISLDGPISLSIWPAITVSAEQVRVANPADFGPGDLAAAEQVGFELAIAPLLRRQLAVDAVLIEGLALDLQRDVDGRGNWEPPQPTTTPTVAERAETDTTPANGASRETQAASADGNGSTMPAAPAGFVLERVASVRLRNASIAYRDAADDRQHRFTGVSVDTGEIRPGQPVTFDASGQGRIDQEPGIDMTVKLTGAIDPAGQRLTLDHIQVAADDSTLTGTFTLTDFLNPVFAFDLAVDTVDLDRYLIGTVDADTATINATASPVNGLPNASAIDPDQSADRVSAANTQTAAADRSQVAKTAVADSDPPADDPALALLDALRGDGQLRVGQLHVRGVELVDTTVTLRFVPGMLDVPSFRSTLADGLIEGSFQLQSDGDGLSVGLEGTATDVRLDALGPLQEAIPFPLLGLGTLRVSLAGESPEQRGLEQFLSGVISLDLSQIDLPEQQIGGDVQARLTLLRGLRNLHLEVDQAELLMRDARFGEQGLGLTVGLDALIDRVDDFARLDAFTLNGAGLTVNATGDLRSLDADAAFTGTLRADHAQLRDLFAALGQPVSDAADPEVLQAFTMESSVRASRTAIELDALDLTLDRSRLLGNLSLIVDPDAPALRYDLQIDTLDLTPYLTAFATETETAASSADQTPEADAASPWHRLSPLANALAATADAPPTATPQPPAFLLNTNVDGVLAIDQLALQELRLEQVQAPISGRSGQFAARPLSARLYGGSYEGALTVDLADDGPVWAFDERLTDVASGPLLTALTGRNFIEGTGDARLRGSARGSSTDALLASLDGEATIALRDGAILGLNIAQLIRDAEARIRGERLDDAGIARETDFTSLIGAITLENGQARIDSLRGESPLFDIDGTGRVDLVDARIDLLLQVLLLQRLERADGRRLPDLGDVPIPLRIQGALAAPSVRLDLERLLRDQFEDQLREEARELERELRDRARDELERLLRRR